jgi:hypothetical protein
MGISPMFLRKTMGETPMLRGNLWISDESAIPTYRVLRVPAGKIGCL